MGITVVAVAVEGPILLLFLFLGAVLDLCFLYQKLSSRVLLKRKTAVGSLPKRVFTFNHLQKTKQISTLSSPLSQLSYSKSTCKPRGSDLSRDVFLGPQNLQSWMVDFLGGTQWDVI